MRGVPGEEQVCGERKRRVPAQHLRAPGQRWGRGLGRTSAGEPPLTVRVSRTGSLCTREFSTQEQKLQRLCVAEQCQCMAGERRPAIG